MRPARRLAYHTREQGNIILYELARVPPSTPSPLLARVSPLLFLVGPPGALLLHRWFRDDQAVSTSLSYLVGGVVFMVLLLGWQVLATVQARHVTAESLLLVKDLGIKLQTRFTDGSEESEFIDLSRVRAVIINEGITLHRVVYYLALVVEGRKELVVAFQHLQPRLEELLPVYHSTKAAIEASRERRGGKADKVDA